MAHALIDRLLSQEIILSFDIKKKNTESKNRQPMSPRADSREMVTSADTCCALNHIFSEYA